MWGVVDIFRTIFPGRCIGCSLLLTPETFDGPSVFPRGWPIESPSFFQMEFSIKVLRVFPVSSQLLCAPCWLKLRPATEKMVFDGIEKIPVVTPFITEALLLKVIRFLKFESGRTAAAPLSWWIAAAIERSDPTVAGSNAMIVPVPLHRSRKTERGYNQAELIAREVSRILRVGLSTGLLTRKKKTRPQSRLDAPGRRANIREAFRVVEPDKLKERKIILIDDLITTGETMKECIKSLQKLSISPIMIVAAGRSDKEDKLPKR